MNKVATEKYDSQEYRKKIDDSVVLRLWSSSGGRCEFHGCNKDLWKDGLTTRPLKISNIAHIVAYKSNGPRGVSVLCEEERNGFENLMLLCPVHHLVVDKGDGPVDYSIDELIIQKANHESRIKHLTGLNVEHETVPVRILGKIRNKEATVTSGEVRSALLSAGRYPYYLGREDGIEIDLRSLGDDTQDGYFEHAITSLEEEYRSAILPRIKQCKIGHMSVFPLARIPILVKFGSLIGDVLPVDLYQRHRDAAVGWKWMDVPAVDFDLQAISGNNNAREIVLILELSGKVDMKAIPKELFNSSKIYKIVPKISTPSTSILESHGSLIQFRQIYRNFIEQIGAKSRGCEKIHLIIAAPAPFAVMCGQERLPEVTASTSVYDFVGNCYQHIMCIE